MTRYVVDAGAVLHLADAGFDVSADHELLAPTLLRSQVLSALHEAVARGDIPAEVGRDRLARIGQMPIRLLGDAVLRRRAWDVADRLGFAVVLSPRQDGDEIARQLVSDADVSALLAGFPINITAPTDNSPFFFQMLRLRDILDLDLLKAGKQSANMAAVFILGALLLAVLLLSGLCIVLPLLVTAGTQALRGSGSLVGYFASIGLG